MRYNERREREQDLLIQEDFTPAVKRCDFSTGLQMVEYYSPSKRDYTIRIITAKHSWLATQNYNLADHVFNKIRRWLHDYPEDALYNSDKSKNVVYDN